MTPSIIPLIQYTLHPETTAPLSPSEQDWYAIYEEAKRQALLGITSYGVQQLRKLHPECSITYSGRYPFSIPVTPVQFSDGNHCSNLDGSGHQSAEDLYLIQQRSNKCGFQMVVGHFADLSKMA